MCFGSNIVETQTRQELPPFIEEAAKRLLSQTEAITGPSVQYTPYGGERLAPLTTEQQLARQAAIQQSQAFRPDLNTARALGLQGTGGITGADIERFRSPYIDNVMRTTLDELERRNQITSQRLADQAVKSGAIGGARFGVLEAELANNLQDIKSKRVFEDLSRNFMQAQQQAIGTSESARARELQAAPVYGQLGQVAGRQALDIGNLGAQQFGLGQQGIQSLLGVGQTQRTRAQALADEQFRQETAANLEPRSRIQFASDILQGIPSVSQTISQQPLPYTNPLAAAVGGGLTGLGTLGSFYNQP